MSSHYPNTFRIIQPDVLDALGSLEVTWNAKMEIFLVTGEKGAGCGADKLDPSILRWPSYSLRDSVPVSLLIQGEVDVRSGPVVPRDHS